jgi:hypothetical protein
MILLACVSDSSRYWLIEHLRRCGDTEHAAYILGYNDSRERGGKVYT